MEDTKKISVRPTGIPELDSILDGGLPSNAAVFVAGPPGAGKSILAMQWLFAGYRDHRESGIYFTLTEPTTKLLANLRSMNFFDKEMVASSDIRAVLPDSPVAHRPGIHFVDLRVIMKDIGIGKKDFTRKDIEKLCEKIVHIANQCDGSRIVLDSITALMYQMGTEELKRAFIFELSTYMGAMAANVLLIGEEAESVGDGIEGFISDGLIRLDYSRKNNELLRTLEIVKMRGINYDAHSTTFRISEDGITLYPRLHRPLTYPVSNLRVGTGIVGFNEMTGGGYIKGSTVAVMGPSGVGKSIASLHFLFEGLRAGEPCVLVSFEESRDQIFQNASGFGWDLAKYEKADLLKLVIADPEDYYLDEHIKHITKAVTECGAKRIVIDSLSSLGNAFGSEGLHDFAWRMSTYFKGHESTSLFTLATEGLTGAGPLSEAHISSFVDAIVMFRYVEIQSELRRAVLVLKMRGSSHDRKLREIVVTSDGISISTDFRGYEAVLSGSTRKIKESVDDQLRVLFLEVLGPMGEKIFNEEKRKGLTAKRVKELIDQLGSQGVLSVQRKADFLDRTQHIFNVNSEGT